jgi:hypothetical protein
MHSEGDIDAKTQRTPRQPRPGLIPHCFDRIVIQGYLLLLTRHEHIHFFLDVHGLYPITPQVLAKRTLEYR